MTDKKKPLAKTKKNPPKSTVGGMSIVSSKLRGRLVNAKLKRPPAKHKALQNWYESP